MTRAIRSFGFVRAGLFLLLLHISCVSAIAQLNYRVMVADSLTGLPIDLEKVQVFVFKKGTNESAALSFGRLYSSDQFGSRQYSTFQLPYLNADYDMTIDAEGYLPRAMNLVANTKNEEVDLGTIKLQRQPRQLDELSVVATKIKVFFNGDTTVYNADAFVLPEGSMLDDLLKQMPGVELKSDGQIFHNGKKVESLLLNGRKLFEDDPMTLLQNLAAFTVKHIKVYDREPESARLLGYSEEKEYVMDVNLKKRYMGATSVTAEGGYGTEDRYLGRLFATSFTSTASVAAYFNANNLSSERMPFRKDDIWNSNRISRTGVSSHLGGGLNYTVNSSAREESLRGNIEVNRSTIDSRQWNNGVIFLPGGDNTSQATSFDLNQSLNLKTSHKYQRQFSRWQLTAFANFKYGKSTDDSRNTSEVVVLNKTLVNRSVRTDNSRSHDLQGDLDVSALIRLPDIGETKHNILIDAYGNYARSHGRYDSYYLIEFGAGNADSQTEQARRQAYPAYNVSTKGTLRYQLHLPSNYTLTTGVTHYHRWDRNTDFRFILPAYTLDPFNSHKSRLNQGTSNVFLGFGAQWGHQSMANGGKGRLKLDISPSVNFNNRKYQYTRPGSPEITPGRNETQWELNQVLLEYKLVPQGRNELGIRLQSSSWVRNIDMAYLVDVTTDADPLNIHRGNPGLRNPRDNSVSLEPSFQLVTPKWNWMNYVTLRYSNVNDEIVNGWIYNPQTGVRRLSHYNVNGTRNLSVKLSSWLYGNNWSIILKGEYADGRNVDMVGTATSNFDTALPNAQYVFRKSYNGSLEGRFDPCRWVHISPEINSNVSHYSGESADFTPFNATDISYKLGLQFKLPQNISLNLSLSYDTRRGYSDPRLNTNEWILNAGADWHWTKPGLRFIIDGYDLLQQILRVSYQVNAQGRTESYNNSIPRYAMLRVIYQFNTSR